MDTVGNLYTNAHIHVHTHTQTHTYTQTHTDAHTQTQTQSHARTHAHARTHTNALTRTCTHAISLHSPHLDFTSCKNKNLWQLRHHLDTYILYGDIKQTI